MATFVLGQSMAGPGVLKRQPVPCAGHGKTVEYAGLKLHEPAKWHTYMGEGLAALMW